MLQLPSKRGAFCAAQLTVEFLMTTIEAHESTIALMQQGRWGDAEHRLNAAIKHNPHDARALRLLGTLCHITKRADEALTHLEQALELGPTNISTLLNLGSVYLDTDRGNDAERCFARVIEIDPTSADGHFNLGLAV
jgi:protein O-GlcNAc transferase